MNRRVFASLLGIAALCASAVSVLAQDVQTPSGAKTTTETGPPAVAPENSPATAVKPGARKSQVDAMFPSQPSNAAPVQPASASAPRRRYRSVRPSASVAPTTFAARNATLSERSVYLRTGPGFGYGRVVLLPVGASVLETGRQVGWSQVKLSDGRKGWIGTKYLQVSAATTPVVKPVTLPAASKNETKPVAVAAGTAAKAASKSEAGDLSALLVDTKKDPFGQSAGGVGVGDTFRLLFYLLPVLGLIVLAVRGLKRVQDKTGWSGGVPGMPGNGAKKKILGGFNLSNSRKTGGSNIRVVESVPIGGMELSLVEVRGRMLLLSSAGGSVNLLTEFKDGENGHSEFATMLGDLSGDTHDANDADDDLFGAVGVTVGSLDDSLRDTREAIVRTAKRTLNSQRGLVD
jgi:uncharacterized protein YgiM (DUF1202 family)